MTMDDDDGLPMTRPHYVEVPSDASIGDVIRVMRLKKELYLPPSSTFSINNDIARVLAKSMVRSNSERIPDIELLFQLFPDPKVKKEVFGYETFAEFRRSNSYRDDMIYRELFMGGVRSCKFTFGSRGEHRDQKLTEIEIDGMPVQFDREDSLFSMDFLDWDILEQFEHLESISITNSQLGGPVPFNKLPRNLKALGLGDSKFCGPVAFDQLPPSLTHLYLGFNHFEGTIGPGSFSHLKQLRRINLSGNDFRGDVPFEELPSSLKELTLEYNLFTGTLRSDTLAHLTKLQFLYLDGEGPIPRHQDRTDQFSGEIKLWKPPASLRISHGPNLIVVE